MDRTYQENAAVQRGQGIALVRHVACAAAAAASESSAQHTGERPALVVADFGCGPGVNSKAPLQAVADVAATHAYMVDSQEDPVLWDQLRRVLAEWAGASPARSSCVVQGSFYDGLPEIAPGSLDIAWCSVAAHWLPELPTPLPRAVIGNQEDPGGRWRCAAAAAWRLFLARRAAEVKPGGRLVVALSGADDAGDFTARGAWDVFAEIKREAVASGLLDEARAARLATREYLRTTPEVLDVDALGGWDLEAHELEHRPCPFLAALRAGRASEGETAEALRSAFRGFLSTEFDAALGSEQAVDAFWTLVLNRAAKDPASMDLHVVMHHLVLRRTDEPVEIPVEGPATKKLKAPVS